MSKLCLIALLFCILLYFARTSRSVKFGVLGISKIECQSLDLEFMKFPLCKAEKGKNDSTYILNVIGSLFQEARDIKVSYSVNIS